MSWCKIRYETTSATLSNSLAPVFPNNMGAEFFSYALNNPKYIQTERFYPMTSARWSIDSLLSTDRGTMWTFWDTTLNRGEYGHTAIDHRKRCLFDVLWSWKERWSKTRGGVSDIVIDMESPYPWTPPLFALYGDVGNSMADHLLDSNSDLTVNDGDMVSNTDDGNVLRLNGNALRISDSAGAQYGAGNTSLSWYQGKNNSSISLFLQISVPDLQAGKQLELIKLSDGANLLRIYVTRNNVNEFDLKFEWQKSGSAAEDLETKGLSANTWYDLALVFDDINDNFFGYFAESASATTAWSTSDDFLDGTSAVIEGILTDNSPTNYPTEVTWTELYLLRATAGDIFVTDSPMSHAYVQNVFVVDDFISPLEFNLLRRHCHLWNSKTSGTWPK